MEQIESRLNDMSIISSDDTKWGWSLTDLYRNALGFYKGNKIENIHFSVIVITNSSKIN